MLSHKWTFEKMFNSLENAFVTTLNEKSRYKTIHHRVSQPHKMFIDKDRRNRYQEVKSDDLWGGGLTRIVFLLFSII